MKLFNSKLLTPNSKLILLFFLCAFTLSGCATTPYVKPVTPTPAMPGVYHRIEKGQTLWKISKIYNVDLDTLATINHIGDITAIETGQLIFIPNRTKTQTIISASSNEDFIWPLKGRTICTFGSTFANMANKGINIQPYANSDVYASRRGKVVFAMDNFGAFGKTIILNHGEGFSTVYARNSEILVRVGDNVEQGNIIAKAGEAGRDRNTYLHFEVRKNGIPQNPVFYLP